MASVVMNSVVLLAREKSKPLVSCGFCQSVALLSICHQPKLEFVLETPKAAKVCAELFVVMEQQRRLCIQQH